MNDLEYFPTPSNVIIEMLHGMGKSDLSKMNILEPSAGEGDICDYLTNNKGVSLSSIKCIEKNYNRCEKLRKKGYTVIDYDFLEHKNDSFYDLILMNPPFSKAEKHLEKALEIGNGAEIRCLVSSGTVNATNLSERKRLEQKLEKLDATYTSLGSCFSNSRVKTNVDVTLISVRSEKRKGVKIDFDFETDVEEQVSFGFHTTEVASNDWVENSIGLFGKQKELMKEILHKISELEYYSENNHFGYRRPIQTILGSDETLKEKYNEMVEVYRSNMWQKILNKVNIDHLLTTAVREEWNEFKSNNKSLSFSKKNIHNFVSELKIKENEILSNCVLEAFDNLTYFSEKNTLKSDRYKTNSHYKINNKVIMPRVLDSEYAKLYDEVSWVNYRNDKITDIEKVLCFLGKTDYKDYASITEIRGKGLFGIWRESVFFEYKFFKNGNVHLKFKDAEVVEKFNLVVNKLRPALFNSNGVASTTHHLNFNKF